MLDALKIAQVTLLGRSCIAAQAFAQAHPERVGHGVLLGPTPPDPSLRRREGLLGVMGTVATEHPALVESLARFIAGAAHARDVLNLSRRTVRHCPADLAALDDPETATDFIRATRQAAIGLKGFTRELGAREEINALRVSALRWTILIGNLDPMYRDLSETAWASTLPNARVVRVPDGGRLLHMTRADLVARALSDEGRVSPTPPPRGPVC